MPPTTRRTHRDCGASPYRCATAARPRTPSAHRYPSSDWTLSASARSSTPCAPPATRCRAWSGHWPTATSGLHHESQENPMNVPVVHEMTVIPVAGHDSMLLNLSGAHGPFFTRNLVTITDSDGNIGVG